MVKFRNEQDRMNFRTVILLGLNKTGVRYQRKYIHVIARSILCDLISNFLFFLSIYDQCLSFKFSVGSVYFSFVFYNKLFHQG